MRKVKEIFLAYLKLVGLFFGIGRQSQVEKERLAVCYGCNNNNLVCPVCHCPVKAKVLSKEAKCPRNLW